MTTPAPEHADLGAAGSHALLACSGVSVTYGKLRVLEAVDFSVGAAEAVGIVGPNGAGKTTLLNALGRVGHAAERQGLSARRRRHADCGRNVAAASGSVARSRSRAPSGA